ncbi:two-component system, response regulator FlrC [Nitrosomonas eutropha]|uniref:sigma-54-dependent transcriptional regulator n=1 Tax=Nitrosomonas TaxID=914 RepID=UPI000892349E|nr:MULTISPECIES: sigma-54 dependent transcriptional regulator [Nitrosomonas]MXS80812.1 sigma-54-dependent Fis family transcriptional regulator [Nitrosomonas sp. GH22]SCX24562.1 two-component system, response regulator FlrC [Nitrosomonas eutropha]SDW41629.1 two-component system, response regulator FlrC [Nitrosomonas eutropha]
MQNLPVLIVEDDPDLLEALCATLKLKGYASLAASGGERALDLLRSHPVGLVISDVQMRPMDGHTLLQNIRRSHPWIPVVLMTAHGEVDKAVAAMRAGARDYLPKPFDPHNLLAYVERYLLTISNEDEPEVVAEDPRTLTLLSLAKKVAATDATVMLMGESGSGKEVLARFVHRHSSRVSQPFVAINCAAIPENLLEATLFGYEKGAFTGAFQGQAGKFEQANGGTLLLDEISEMPLSLQVKLLRVLQEREVERVGSNKAVKLDIRLIATSNRDMQAYVRASQFREDLYYRLNVFPLEIPPLRERVQDIVPLAQYILDKSTQPGCTLTKSAMLSLERYTWPGNVRELENVMQRAMILATGPIEPAHLNLPESPMNKSSQENVQGVAESSLCDIKSLERDHILQTLAAVNGSRKLAVQKLGISERTLRYKLQQYRLAEC